MAKPAASVKAEMAKPSASVKAEIAKLLQKSPKWQNPQHQ
jgi:hypothetical protein